MGLRRYDTLVLVAKKLLVLRDDKVSRMLVYGYWDGL